MTTTSDRREQIAASLQDKEYRDLFVTEEIDTGVPFQIRVMRQARGWSQKEFAARLGMTQEGVSRLENPNYGKLTLTTLKRLASAFDVALAVHFVPFSRLVDWAANLSPDDLAVPDYEHDLGLAPAFTAEEMSQEISTHTDVRVDMIGIDSPSTVATTLPHVRLLPASTTGLGWDSLSDTTSGRPLEKLGA